MSFLSDAIDRLDRAHGLFDATEDAALYSELHWFLSLLGADPVLGDLLRELQRECLVYETAARGADDALSDELHNYKDALLKAFPELEQPAEDEDFAASYSFERFARVAVEPSHIGVAWTPINSNDRSRCRDLLYILQIQTNRSDDAKEQLGSRLRELANKHIHNTRSWLLFQKTHPSAAARRVLRIAEHQNPEPNETGTFLERAARRIRDEQSPYHPMREAEFTSSPPPDDARRLTEFLRIDARRVVEEIRRRLLTTRSHRALVMRFAQWVAQYERDRLRKMALADPSNAEAHLTLQLARFLFERGLNPLSETNVAQLRADLLDPTTPWTFYVEAKQYTNSPRAKIRKAVNQVADTLVSLRGLPNPVREAFLIIFRVAGAPVELPRSIEFDGSIIYPVLVDVAEAKQTGSKQSKSPVVLTDSDLIPESTDSTG